MEMKIDREKSTFLTMESKPEIINQLDPETLRKNTTKKWFIVELPGSKRPIKVLVTEIKVPHKHPNFEMRFINEYLVIDLTHQMPAKAKDKWGLIIEYVGP